MKTAGVRTYLFAVLSVLTAIPVLWLGNMQATRFEEEVRQYHDETLKRASTETSQLLGQFAQTVLTDISVLGRTLETFGEDEQQKAHTIVSRHWKYSGYYEGMYVADQNANVLFRANERHSRAGSRNYADRDYYQALRKTLKTSISRVQLGRVLKVPNVHVAAPLLSPGGRLRGYVEGSVDLGALLKLVGQVSSETGIGRVTIIDSEGRIVADSMSNSTHVLRNVRDVPLFVSGASSLAVAADEKDVAQRRALTGVTALPGWHVVASESVALVEGQVSRARRQVWLGTGIALLAALALAALLSNWLGRRFAELAETVQRIGQGQFEHRARPASRWEPSEIRTLVEQLDLMAERTQHHTQDLASEVEERTVELASVNARLELLVKALERAEDGIEITTPEGLYVYVNPALERFTGYSPDELIGHSPKLLLNGSHAEQCHEEMAKQISTGKVFAGAFSGRRKDGSSFEQELTVWPVLDSTGAVTHCVGLRRDITERKQTERALRVSERMASLGTLAAGVAHEINNPLTYVLLSLRLVEKSLRRHWKALPDSFAEETSLALEHALEGSERVKAIVKDLKTFSRPDDDTMAAVDIQGVLESALRMVGSDIRHRAKLDFECGEELRVTANQARLSQVFLNLLVNASQSLSGLPGKRDEIRVIAHEATSSGSTLPNVVVEISDTGRGIAPEHLDRIFDPFFTTKPVGVGTGLGLALSHSIVTGLGGDIQVSSKPGKGTTFRITLPACTPKAAESSGSPNLEKEHDACPASRVLVIDDDPAVARAIAELLSQHEVLTAHSGAAALKLMAAHSVDAILCDIMMPGQTGLEFYDAVSRVFPGSEQQIIFMTAGSRTQELKHFLDRTGAACLDKPVDELKLDRQLSRQLRQSSPPDSQWQSTSKLARA